MKVAIGCDPNASEHKKVLKKLVEDLGHECIDFGSEDPIYAIQPFVWQRPWQRGNVTGES